MAPPKRSLVLDMAWRRVDTTDENISKTEEELDKNDYRWDEKFIEEERKTLAWLRESLLPGVE